MVCRSNPTSHLSHDAACIELMLFELDIIIHEDRLTDFDIYNFVQCLDDIGDRAEFMNPEVSRK